MERHFVVPVIVAASVHGLLFVLPGGAKVPTTLIADAVAPHDPMPPEVIELMPPDPVASDVVLPSGGSPDRPPQLPDEPRADNSDAFVVKVQPQSVAKITPGLDRIDANAFGPPGTGTGVGVNVGDIVRAGALDHAPRARVQIAPDYPFAARHDGLSGEVVVEFVVDEAGRVMSPHVASSSDSVFNEAAVRAVSKWRFEPGTVQGRVVRFRMAVPVMFHLNE